MGLETECRAWFDGKPSIGKAHLEAEELTFRGDFTLRIPTKQVKTVEARGGQLQVVWLEGEAIFELGKAAESWMLKIRYPRGRLEKLGVKDAMRVAVVGLEDEAFETELATKNVEVNRRLKKDTDLIFFAVDAKAKLDQLASMAAYLKPAGSIWTIYPKGQKHITQADVMTAGKAAGLVDTKVVAFSQTHSSLKWVIPVAKRK